MADEGMPPDPSFVEKVKQYLEIIKDLDAAKEEMDLVKQSKKELEADILEFMEEHDVDEVDADGGFKIKLRVSKTKKPLNKEQIYNELQKAIGKERAEVLTSQIVDNRETSERTAVSLIRPRKKT